jgi:hypothetical protein
LLSLPFVDGMHQSAAIPRPARHFLIRSDGHSGKKCQLNDNSSDDLLRVARLGPAVQFGWTIDLRWAMRPEGISGYYQGVQRRLADAYCSQVCVPCVYHSITVYRAQMLPS